MIDFSLCCDWTFLVLSDETVFWNQMIQMSCARNRNLCAAARFAGCICPVGLENGMYYLTQQISNWNYHVVAIDHRYFDGRHYLTCLLTDGCCYH